MWGSGCIYPCILDLSTSWRWVVSFMPRPVYLRYPLDKEAGRAPELIWMMWRREKCRPYWNSNSDPSAIQPIMSCYPNNGSWSQNACLPVCVCSLMVITWFVMYVVLIPARVRSIIEPWKFSCMKKDYRKVYSFHPLNTFTLTLHGMCQLALPPTLHLSGVLILHRNGMSTALCIKMCK
jgi:hypothetical protein